MNEKHLEEAKQDYIKAASTIPNWENIDNNELLMKYIQYDNEGNETFKNAYISALILNSWDHIYGWAASTKGNDLNEMNYYDWLINSIGKAIKYIRCKEDQIKENILKPEQLLNECLNKAIEREMPVLIKDKRRANYNAIRVDSIAYNLHADKDYNDGYDIVAGGEEEKYNGLNIEFLIKYYLKKDMRLEACIIYLITHSDCLTKESQNLKIRALINNLRDDYYCEEVRTMLGTENYNTIKRMSTTAIRNRINTSLKNLRADPTLKENL